MTPITVWALWNPKGKEWEHNHFEFDHVTTQTPEPKGDFPSQRSWPKGVWKRTHAFLSANNVIHERFTEHHEEFQT